MEKINSPKVNVDDVCFPEGIGVALAAARAAGKPLFTMENLNALARNPQANKALAAEALQDISGFLRQHFYFTPAQAQQLDGIPEPRMNEIIKALQPISVRGGPATFSTEVTHSASTHDRMKTTTTKTIKGNVGVDGFGGGFIYTKTTVVEN